MTDSAQQSSAVANREWYPGLDGLRAFCFLGIFTLHLPPPFIRPMRGGYIVMEGFFVLSGFLITTILLREFERRNGINVRKFYGRRAARLLPAVVLFTTAVYILTYLDPYLKQRGADYRRHSLASLSYFYNWIAIYSFNRHSGAPGFVAHLWSLSVEEQFYLVWPLVLWFVMRRAKRRTSGSLREIATAIVPWLIGAIVVSNVLRTLIGFVFENGSSYTRANWGTDTRASGMLLGALGAVIRLGRPEWFAKIRRVLPVIGWMAVAVVVPALWLYPNEPNPFPFAGGFLLTELSSLVIILCVVERAIRPLSWLCELRPLRWVGKVSYGAYVFHFMLIGRFFYYENKLRFPYPTLLALTLVVAGLSNRFVEQPVSRWARRRFRLGS